MGGFEDYLEKKAEKKLDVIYTGEKEKSLEEKQEEPMPADLEQFRNMYREKMENPEVSFEDRTQYYFEDSQMMASKAQRYQAIARDKNKIAEYATAHKNYGVGKRTDFAQAAANAFGKAATMESNFQKKGHTKKDFALYEHREKVMRLRMEGMVNAAKLKSKSQSNETYRVLKAKYSCLNVLKEQLDVISQNAVSDKEIKKFDDARRRIDKEIKEVEKNLTAVIPTAYRRWEEEHGLLKVSSSDRPLANVAAMEKDNALDGDDVDSILRGCIKNQTFSQDAPFYDKNALNDQPVMESFKRVLNNPCYIVKKDKNGLPLDSTEMKKLQWNQSWLNAVKTGDRDTMNEMIKDRYDRLAKFDFPSPEELKKKGVKYYLTKDPTNFYEVIRLAQSAEELTSVFSPAAACISRPEVRKALIMAQGLAELLKDKNANLRDYQKAYETSSFEKEIAGTDEVRSFSEIKKEVPNVSAEVYGLSKLSHLEQAIYRDKELLSIAPREVMENASIGLRTVHYDNNMKPLTQKDQENLDWNKTWLKAYTSGDQEVMNSMMSKEKDNIFAFPFPTQKELDEGWIEWMMSDFPEKFIETGRRVAGSSDVGDEEFRKMRASYRELYNYVSNYITVNFGVDINEKSMRAARTGEIAKQEYKVKMQESKIGLNVVYQEDETTNLLSKTDQMAFNKGEKDNLENNTRTISRAESDLLKKRHSQMRKLMQGREIGTDKQTYNDLSVFLTGNESADKKLLDRYLGRSIDSKTGLKKGAEINEAMEIITSKILSLDVDGISFASTEEMAKSAEKLETIVSSVGAYDRLLSKNEHYFRVIASEKINRINKKLEELRAVGSYYLTKKEILFSDEYRNGKANPSMELSPEATKQQNDLTRKLIESKVRAMNLVSMQGRIILPPEIEFKFVTKESQEYFNKALESNNANDLRKYLEKAYTSMDHLAFGNALRTHTMFIVQGSDARFETFKKSDTSFAKRPDADEIRNTLRSKYGEKFSRPIANEHLAVKVTGLTPEKMLSHLNSYNTAHMSKNEILDMFSKILGPVIKMDDNDNDVELVDIQQKDEDFKKGMRQYRGIVLDSLRAYSGTMGNLITQTPPDQLKSVFRSVGDVLNCYSSVSEDARELLNESFDEEVFDPENEETKEFTFLTHYVSCMDTGIKKAYNEADKNGTSANGFFAEAVADYLIKNEGALSIGNIEKNPYLQGPTMGEHQFKAILQNYAKENSEDDLEGFLDLRSLMTGEMTEDIRKELLEDQKQVKFENAKYNQDDYNIEKMIELEEMGDKDMVELQDLKEEKDQEEKKEEQKKEEKKEEKKQEQQQNVQVQDLQLPQYKISLNSQVNYERQSRNNCFACSGAAIFNQFLLNENPQYDKTKFFGQLDLRDVELDFKPYEQVKDMLNNEEQQYINNVDDIIQRTGLQSTKVNSLMEIADFFISKRKDICVNRMVFNMPVFNAEMSKEKKDAHDAQRKRLKKAFLDKVNEVLKTGNFVSVLHGGHYMTITGIDGENLEVLNSSKGVADNTKPVRRTVSELMESYRNGVIDNSGNLCEITWLSKAKTPEEMTAEYPNLQYDEENGYSVKEHSMDEVLFLGQTKGVLASRQEADSPAGGGIVVNAYVAKMDKTQRQQPDPELNPKYGQIPHDEVLQKTGQQKEDSVSDTISSIGLSAYELEMQQIMLATFESKKTYDEEMRKRKEQQSKDERAKRKEEEKKKEEKRESFLKQIVMPPSVTAISRSFGKSFKDKISSAERKKRITGDKSYDALKIKDKNARELNETASRYNSDRIRRINQAMGERNQGADVTTLRDLSVFLTGVEKEDQTILDHFLGTKKGAEGALETNFEQGIDLLADKILNMNIDKLDLSSDEKIAQNAYQLEQIVCHVGAFERIKDKHPDAFAKMNKSKQRDLDKRLNDLRAIACYYLSKKDLINDEYYKTHYNDELSMTTPKNATQAQKDLGEKLTRFRRDLTNLTMTGGQSTANRQYFTETYAKYDNMAGIL